MSIARTIHGTNGADSIVLTDDFVTEFVYAGAGNDTIADGKDDPWSSDYFWGQGGSDTLFSRSGFDFLSGGTGDDLIKVKAAQFDAGAIPGAPGGPEDWRGFDVVVNGGSGEDVLRITNSDGYEIEIVGDTAFITTRFGGIITATGIEQFDFL